MVLCSSPGQLSPGLESKPIELDQTHSMAQKRKASSPLPAEKDPAVSPKRSKVDRDATERDTSRSTHALKDRSTDRRQSASQEERNRGRRLYGSLLNTLSQTTTNSHQKRRQEIERRQQAKVTQQRAEDDKHSQEKLARLNIARKVEQVKFDEQVVSHLPRPVPSHNRTIAQSHNRTIAQSQPPILTELSPRCTLGIRIC